MSLKCPCGGTYRRSDVVPDMKLSAELGRPMFKDTDPLYANWKCDTCGRPRRQKKRQPARRPDMFQHD